MASKLATLIRLHRWRIDDARRQLALLEKRQSEIEDVIASLDARLLAEASHEPEPLVVVSGNLHEFIVQTLATREEAAASWQTLAAEVGACRDALREMIWERRRLELRVEQMAEEERQSAQQKENNTLDDQSTIRFILRKSANNGSAVS